MAASLIERTIAAGGGANALGRKLGITRQAVGKWRDIPLRRIIAIEAATGIPREELRPDFYRRKKKA